MLLFVLANWKWLLGAFAAAGLAIALFFARADAAHWKKQDEAHVAAWQLEIAKHAITRQSLATALAEIDQQNAAVDKLKTDGDARRAAAEQATRAAQEAAQRNSGLVRALEASAAKARPAGECKASAAFEAARKEL